MYSSSPIRSYALLDRRPTLGTMDSPQHQQQSWAPTTMLKQHQDMDMDYMVHHGYHVTPTSISSSPQYHQHHLLATQPPSNKQQMNRAVIPSKRAAQNRAAQKAFRQRKEQYIKQLEKKSKEMDLWKQELDTMKDENRQLKSLVNQLELRISSLTYQQVTENNSVSPTTSTSSAAVLSPTIPSSSPRSPSVPTLSISSVSHPSSSPSPTTSPLVLTHPPIPSPSPSQQQQQSRHSFLLPISLRPHSFLPSMDDSPSIPSTTTTSFVVAAPPAGHVAAASTHPPPAGRQTPLFELDLDPFFDDDFGFPRIDDQLDFVGHTSGGQVLDDLFAMLQTRQRPQIPLQPHQQQQGDDQPSSHYSMVDHVMPGQHSSSS